MINDIDFLLKTSNVWNIDLFEELFCFKEKNFQITS